MMVFVYAYIKFIIIIIINHRRGDPGVYVDGSPIGHGVHTWTPDPRSIGKIA